MISEDRRARDISSAESQKSKAMHENGNCLAPKIKLPTIEIRKFGGHRTEFKHFHHTFKSLIISNQALYDVKKFHYLFEPAVPAAQTAPVASVVYRITASDLEPHPCLSLFGRPLVIGWRRRGAGGGRSPTKFTSGLLDLFFILFCTCFARRRV